MLSELMPCIGQSCQTPAGRTELTPVHGRTRIQMQVTAGETRSGRKSYFAHYSQDLWKATVEYAAKEPMVQEMQAHGLSPQDMLVGYSA